MNPLTYIKSKKASLVAIAAVLLFFTCGLPERVTSDHWQLFNLWDIEDKKIRAIVGIIFSICVFALIAQGLNEYKKGGKDVEK